MENRSTSRVPTDEPVDPLAPYEAELVALYESDRGIFEKSQRKSPKRQEFRRRTGLSDEQVEGWLQERGSKPAAATTK